MSDLVGRRLGRYEIVKLLGAGGMGEVYRARDTQLGRQVAVKVLGGKASGDAERLARFEKEARAVAVLSHPNILAIHDFGEDGGVAYAVTELLEGKSLRERMGDSPLPVTKALEIGKAVAEGLAAAHARGIVHRDIKPENIFITSTGHVKILDFGIASLTGEEILNVCDPKVPTASTPKTVRVIGTVGYMAPEQARGEPTDARGDIFALGCVLYEMVTGKRAFRGETPTDTLVATLDRDPPPIGETRPDVPPVLEMVIRRCLEKQPAERFDSAHDVAFALQAVSLVRDAPVVTRRAGATARSSALRGGAIVLAVGAIAAVAAFGVHRGWFGALPLPKEKHLAVARFEAEGQDPGLQQVAAALTEEVRQGLELLEEAGPGTFWIVPRAEADRRDVGVKNIADLGRKFGVTAVITGAVRRRGERLRLELAAVDPSTERSFRTTAIEDRLSNLSAFQEEPVLGVARLLGLKVTPEARARLKQTGTTMTAAFEAYLSGVGALEEAKDAKDVDRAVGLLETAVSSDPLFVAARVVLGRAYLRKFALTKKVEWAERAAATAEPATKESGWPAAGYRLLAAADSAAGRSSEALAALEKAARVASSSAAVHLDLANAYEKAKRFSDAEKELRHVVFLQPGYWPPHHLLGRLYESEGNYEAAAVEDRAIIACAPKYTRGYNNLGAMYFYLGRRAEAREAFERSLVIEPSRSTLSNLGTLAFDDARFGDAAELFERALKVDDTRYLTWGNLGYAYKFGRTPDKAPACFRKAAELVKKRLEASPDDPQLLTDLAGYDGMLGQRAEGLALLERVVKQNPTEQDLIAQVAETFEDLGDRSRALRWVARSFEAGESPSRFEGRPTLRALVADEAYRKVAAKARRNP
jgi:tetratricopeptide (TPR) repeat protein